jgi:hypothetical protein
MDPIGDRIVELSLDGYFCSQILMILALEAQGREDPDLVRAMTGLALGGGQGKGTCGGLAGGACVIGLHAGKGNDDEDPAELLWKMLGELWSWFDDEVGSAYGGVGCNEIMADGAPRTQRCATIVSRTYARVMEILIENGFDPAEGRSG